MVLYLYLWLYLALILTQGLHSKIANLIIPMFLGLLFGASLCTMIEWHEFYAICLAHECSSECGYWASEIMTHWDWVYVCKSLSSTDLQHSSRIRWCYKCPKGFSLFFYSCCFMPDFFYTIWASQLVHSP